MCPVQRIGETKQKAGARKKRAAGFGNEWNDWRRVNGGVRR